MATSAQEIGNQQQPIKTCELQNHHLDTTRWKDFPFRPDDIVIASWGKSGTTWTQQIVSQLIFNGAEDTQINQESPWLDLRVVPTEAILPALEAQTHRRFIKTHAPIETVEFSPKAKYIFVARDGRDALWSLHNHNYNATSLFYEIMNDTPGRVGPALQRPPADPRQRRERLRRDTVLEDDPRLVRGAPPAEPAPGAFQRSESGSGRRDPPHRGFLGRAAGRRG
jgi:hypothetical protein